MEGFAHFSKLPSELMNIVLSKLLVEDFMKVRKINKNFKNILEERLPFRIEFSGVLNLTWNPASSDFVAELVEENDRLPLFASCLRNLRIRELYFFITGTNGMDNMLARINELNVGCDILHLPEPMNPNQTEAMLKLLEPRLLYGKLTQQQLDLILNSRHKYLRSMDISTDPHTAGFFMTNILMRLDSVTVRVPTEATISLLSEILTVLTTNQRTIREFHYVGKIYGDILSLLALRQKFSSFIWISQGSGWRSTFIMPYGEISVVISAFYTNFTVYALLASPSIYNVRVDFRKN